MDDSLILCRCEEVTLGDLKQVLAQGVTTAHGLKLFSRAGMGMCQGRTCRALVEAMAAEFGLPARPLSFRLPVRPVPLGAIAAAEAPDGERVEP